MTAPPSDPSQAEVKRRYAWKPGTVYTYHLQYDTVQQASPLPGTAELLTGALQLDATLELHVHGVRGQVFEMSARLHELTHARFRLAGTDIWKEPSDAQALFEQRSLAFEVDSSGAIQAIVGSDTAEQDDDQRLFEHTMQTLLTELQAQLDEAGAARWTREEVAPYGRAQSDYEALTEADTYRRRRSEATLLQVAKVAGVPATHELTAEHRFALREGVLAELQGSEQLHVRGPDVELQAIRTQVFLRLRDTREAPLARLSTDGKTRRPLQQLAHGRATRRRLLEDRTAGMDRAAFIAQLLAAAGGARGPEHARFLWRATGLLELSPELCAQLATQVAQPDATHELRSLALDMLASVPTATANDAMVDILSSEELQADARFFQYLQRLGLSKTPSERTLALVEQLHGQADDGAALHSAIYTLGSVAGGLAPGSPEQQRALGHLRAGLHRAAEPAAVESYVAALGNTGLPTVVPDLVHYADAASASLRGTVAAALGRVPGPEADSGLVLMASDADGRVQREAYRRLASRALSPQTLREIASAADHGVAEQSLPFVIDLLQRARHGQPQLVAQIAAALLSAAELSAQHRALLESLAA